MHWLFLHRRWQQYQSQSKLKFGEQQKPWDLSAEPSTWWTAYRDGAAQELGTMSCIIQAQIGELIFVFVLLQKMFTTAIPPWCSLSAFSVSSINDLPPVKGRTPSTCSLTTFYHPSTDKLALWQGYSKKSMSHITIWYFFITDRIRSNELWVKYCPTEDMHADIFTKSLQGSLFCQVWDNILNVDYGLSAFETVKVPRSVLRTENIPQVASQSGRIVAK